MACFMSAFSPGWSACTQAPERRWRRSSCVPGDDAKSRTTLGLSPRDHLALGIDGFADQDGSVVGEIVDAEKRAATLAQILDAHAEHGVEHKERADDQIRKSVRPRIVEVRV